MRGSLIRFCLVAIGHFPLLCLEIPGFLPKNSSVTIDECGNAKEAGQTLMATLISRSFLRAPSSWLNNSNNSK